MQKASLPIKLLYTSHLPVIITVAYLLVIYWSSQMLQLFFTKNSILVSICGQWSEVEMRPVGGLAYFLSPPDKWY
jgi:preprotein translocase subunit SecY